MKLGRHLCCAVLVANVVLFGSGARGDSAAVPYNLQVELFAKVGEYDKTLPGRSEGVVRIGVLSRSGSAESMSASSHVMGALSNVARMAGLPHEEQAIEFDGVDGIAALSRSRRLSILYLSPGLSDVTEAIAKSLAGVPVMTLSAVAGDVSRGAVLGFDLSGGKPKLLVNLTTSRAQGVVLSADVLKIATVIR